MPEIRGTLSSDGRTFGPCVWCLEPSDALGETPGRPDLGSVPIHVFCAGAVIVAYRRGQAGKLDVGGLRQIVAFEQRLKMIGDGRKAGADFDQAVAKVAEAFATGGTVAALPPGTIVGESGPEIRLRDVAGYPDETLVARASDEPEGFSVDRDGSLRREIESRNRAFAGEPFAVSDPEE